MAAINSARQQHSAKKNISNANHGQKSQNRYYQAKPGKYDDLKPGILGPESRECLGIGVSDLLVSFLCCRFHWSGARLSDCGGQT